MSTEDRSVWRVYNICGWGWMSHLIPRPMCSKTLDRETSFAWKGFLFSLNSCARQIRQPSSGTPYPISLETYLLMRSAVHLSPHSVVIFFFCRIPSNRRVIVVSKSKKTPVLTNGELSPPFVNRVCVLYLHHGTKTLRRYLHVASRSIGGSVRCTVLLKVKGKPVLKCLTPNTCGTGNDG